MYFKRVTLPTAVVLSLIAVVLALLSLTRPPSRALTVAAQDGCSVYGISVSAGVPEFVCIDDAQPPPPADTPIPPTPTAVPPTNTPTPEPVGELCAHSTRIWHPLQGNDCHWNHEHKDDPHQLDDVLGSGFYDLAGGELSYPWQTPLENQNKHEGYGWLVRSDIPCPLFDSEACITDIRVQYHGLMSAQGAVVRHHSGYMEARVCDRSAVDCGIIRIGGWLDYNKLRVDGQHVPLANDGDASASALKRDHESPENTSNAIYDDTWYSLLYTSSDLRTFLAIRGESWGPVDPDNPSDLLFFCPDFQCKYNGSRMELHSVSFWIKEGLDGQDGSNDGMANISGYLTRYGRPAPGCTEVGLDCVPYSLENVPVGNVYKYRDGSNGLNGGLGEYDVSPPGEWWIEYPN